MESNGKRVSVEGEVLPFTAGEVNFGEPGTNGQHSFYQLLHQGQEVPCDFIGFCESQEPLELCEWWGQGAHEGAGIGYRAQAGSRYCAQAGSGHRVLAQSRHCVQAGSGGFCVQAERGRCM